jgi:hypothetical protein
MGAFTCLLIQEKCRSTKSSMAADAYLYLVKFASGLHLRNSFEQDSACCRNAYELFVSSPDIGMRLLGKPSECSIHLASFKLPVRRQIQCLAMFPLVHGLAPAVVSALPAGESRKILVYSLLGSTAQVQ